MRNSINYVIASGVTWWQWWFWSWNRWWHHYSGFPLPLSSRFIYFGVIAPGRCSDQVAFEQTFKKSTSLETSARVLESFARLHNYVIDEKKIDNKVLDDNQILSEIIPVASSPFWLGIFTNCGTIVYFPWQLCYERRYSYQIENLGLATLSL